MSLLEAPHSKTSHTSATRPSPTSVWSSTSKNGADNAISPAAASSKPPRPPTISRRSRGSGWNGRTISWSWRTDRRNNRVRLHLSRTGTTRTLADNPGYLLSGDNIRGRTGRAQGLSRHRHQPWQTLRFHQLQHPQPGRGKPRILQRIRQRIADDLSLLPKTKECYQR